MEQRERRFFDFQPEKLGLTENAKEHERAIRYFSSCLYEPYHSKEWHEKHPDIDFWSLEREVMHAIALGEPISEPFTKFLVPIYLSSGNQSQDNLLWLLNVAKDERLLRVLAPIIVCAARMAYTFVTLKEAGEMSGMTDSPWRQRCQNGEVPGAVFTGGIWLIPMQHMIRLGYME